MSIDNHIDDHVDSEIEQFLSKDTPKCFFTFAGAGSGKTRSLIKALEYLRRYRHSEFSLRSRKIAVITYTNAACDTILNRIQYDELFAVSTIHSFIWDLIKYRQYDIKEWIRGNLITEINDLTAKQNKVKTPNKTSQNRAEKIQYKKQRLEQLDHVKRFSYSPNGENTGYDSLNHAEVISMGAYFIGRYPIMQNILISKYPILLIDESQDTKKELIDALLHLYQMHKSQIIIGMFGDTMQRIYSDGKHDMASCIPEEWAKPTKKMNHRSAKRIVDLANAIRGTIDQQKQQARSDCPDGFVRLYIASSHAHKQHIEETVKEQMSQVTGQNPWECTSLILEHHMAASRMGFLDMFSPIYNGNGGEKVKTALLDGTLPEIALFTKIIRPLIEAVRNNKKFEVAKIVKQYSPLLRKSILAKTSKSQIECLKEASQAVQRLTTLWETGDPLCLDILAQVEASGLFEIPENLQGLSSLSKDDIEPSSLSFCFFNALKNVRFTQMECYDDYISQKTLFHTHQGVKGLEFPNVLVILDDNEAKGFLFSYDKLFGAKEESAKDIENSTEGKDTSISRTSRLFYVACTRAQKSLAIVAYTSNPNAVKHTAILNGWFNENEIILLEG